MGTANDPELDIIKLNFRTSVWKHEKTAKPTVAPVLK